MEPQESEQATETDEGRQMQVLETLTPEAEVFLSALAEDGFSYKHLLPRNYFNIIGQRVFYPLDVEGLASYVGIDASAPLGAKTPSVVEVSNLVCNLAIQHYPDDEKLQYLIGKWAELEKLAFGEFVPEMISLNEYSVPAMGGGYEAIRTASYSSRKRPSEIISLKKEFNSVIISWGVEEIRRLHDIFSGLLASLREYPETYFIPRYITRIHMREEDGELRGQIQKNGEKDIYGGSFVAVSVSPMTCFSRIVFTLGLQPGYHVLAGHGNADDPKSDLYVLRNIRMKLKDDVHRQNQHSFERWGLLYAQTYEGANEIKKLNDADTKDSTAMALEDLWRGNIYSRKPASENPEIWVTGEELEKELGQPDDKFRHTVRAVAVRKSGFSEEWEILTVTERGDNADERIGKPPMIGVPGGMREKDATIRQTLCRETENEAQTKSVDKIIALVGLQKKKKRSDSELENIDHWFYVKLDNEAGLSKKMIEGNEIYSVQWIPLSELAGCGFQNTRHKNKTVWDVRKVHERRLLSVNHAANLIRILPRISDLELPANWEDFKKNLRNFQSDNFS